MTEAGPPTASAGHDRTGQIVHGPGEARRGEPRTASEDNEGQPVQSAGRQAEYAEQQVDSAGQRSTIVIKERARSNEPG